MTAQQERDALLADAQILEDAARSVKIQGGSKLTEWFEAEAMETILAKGCPMHFDAQASDANFIAACDPERILRIVQAARTSLSLPSSGDGRDAEAVAWRDPKNYDPAQSVTFDKNTANKWPHIYSQPLYAAQPSQDERARPVALSTLTADALRGEKTRFLNLVLDIRRVINWETPLNGFEVVRELQEYIEGLAASAPALQAGQGERRSALSTLTARCPHCGNPYRTDDENAEHCQCHGEIRQALAELVAVNDLKERLTNLHEMGHGTDYGDYHRREPAAWVAARAALAASAPALQAGQREPTCPACHGSGEGEAMEGRGPDTYTVTILCEECGGSGSIAPTHERAAPAPVPPGIVLVPIEPTNAMWDAAIAEQNRVEALAPGQHPSCFQIYKAMIAASQDSAKGGK